MYKKRLVEIVDIAFKSLYEKINGGLIIVDNEASLQLQLSYIIKTIGELFVYHRNELFSIELEKPVKLTEGNFTKSKSPKAKIDIFLSLENISTKDKQTCAIELKYFKKSNHREPNNRYDVFSDISNLENYGKIANFGILLVATDHSHYFDITKTYSKDTCDFDFRDGKKYNAGKILKYRTNIKDYNSIRLRNNYEFKWTKYKDGINFMKLLVNSSNKDLTSGRQL